MWTDKTVIVAADSGTHSWQLNLLSGRFSQVLEVLYLLLLLYLYLFTSTVWQKRSDCSNLEKSPGLWTERLFLSLLEKCID